MPSLDQSVARHVGLDLSNISTPLWIAAMMVVLDLSKACCRLSSQDKVLLGLRRFLNGSMVSIMLNVNDT